MASHRAAERICGPRVRMQNGPLVKLVPKETHPPRGVRGHAPPGKIFKSKVARIALVTISTSRYNRKIIQHATRHA